MRCFAAQSNHPMKVTAHGQKKYANQANAL